MSNEICTVCGISNDKVKKCSACGNVAYCGVKCQRKDWAEHKFSCKSWKVTTDPKNPTRGRFVVATRKIQGIEFQD